MNPSGERLLGLSGSESGGSFRAVLGSGARALAAVIDESLATRRPIVRRTVALRPAGVAGAGASHLGVSVCRPCSRDLERFRVSSVCSPI